MKVKPGPVFGRSGLQLEQKRPVDLLDVDAAACIGSNALASSISLRAAAPGSAKGRSVANFMMRHYVVRQPLSLDAVPFGRTLHSIHRPRFIWIAPLMPALRSREPHCVAVAQQSGTDQCERRIAA